MKLEKIFPSNGVNHASDYSDLLHAITGNNGKKIAPVIRRSEKQETDVEFERRISITHFDNETVYTPIYHNIYKTKNKISKIKLDEDTSDEYRALLENNYQNNKPLVDYIYDDILEDILKNPNAVLVINYDSSNKTFKNKLIDEKHIKNIVLDDTGEVLELSVSYGEGGMFYYNKDLNSIFNFDPNVLEANKKFAVEIDKETDLGALEPNETYKYEGDYFVLNQLEQRNNPFVFLGYEKYKKYYKSFLDPVIPHLIRYAETTSEHALTVMKHGFPKTVAIAPKCEAKGCNKGRIGVNGETCKSCDGKGYVPVSKSGGDIVLVTPEYLQNPISGSTMSIDQMYKVFPTSLDSIKWQEDKLEMIQKQAFNSIFYNVHKNDNSNQAESWRTILARKRAENEALIPFANFMIKLSRDIINKSSLSFNNNANKGNIVFFPQLVDLSISEISQIIQDLKAISADPAIIEYYSNKMIEEVYGEKSTEVLFAEIKKQLSPFTNISKEEMAIIISNDLTRKIDLFIHYNFGKIIAEIQGDGKIPLIYENKTKIIDEIISKAQTMLNEVNNENSNNALLNTNEFTG